MWDPRELGRRRWLGTTLEERRALGRIARAKGVKLLSKKRRKEIAKNAARARWARVKAQQAEKKEESEK